jgi:hypothetical protein
MRLHAIDDEGIDEPVLSCRLFLLDQSHLGGTAFADLFRATEEIVAEMREGCL